MKKHVSFLTILFCAFFIALFYFLFSGQKLALTPIHIIPENIESNDEKLQNLTNLPLTIEEGFQIKILADNIAQARVLAFDHDQNLWVSQTRQGKITKISWINDDTNKVHKETVFEGLNLPHGLAFDTQDPNILYIAETHRISKVDISSPHRTLIPISDLPGGGRHFTRTIQFGPDDKLYISIGSSCDTCLEQDRKRATIARMNKDGTHFEIFANGLRNSVFFTWDDQNQLWATDMGRDFLGDDLPPDEINIVKENQFYGWPYCFGNNIQDMTFNASAQAAQICEQAQASTIDLQAHSAPLGIAFFPSSWPQPYAGQMLVAYHGSWNRSIPTGYKVVLINPSQQEPVISEFITGWLGQQNEVYGRPADILIRDNALYISDDHIGVIYEVKWIGH